MWGSVRELIWQNASYKFTEDLLKALLYRLLQALDYLHSEAHLIHTGESPPYQRRAKINSSSCRY